MESGLCPEVFWFVLAPVVLALLGALCSRLVANMPQDASRWRTSGIRPKAKKRSCEKIETPQGYTELKLEVASGPRTRKSNSEDKNDSTKSM